METEVFRQYILNFINKYFSKNFSDLDIIDIGCGPCPLTDFCDTFEIAIPYSGEPIREITFIGNAEFIDEIVDKKYDVVYSSHLLEDFEEEKTVQILKRWSSLLKDMDSLLILLLPDQKRYRKCCEENGSVPNQSHKMEDFNLNYISNCCSVSNLKFLFSMEFFKKDSPIQNPYNFLYICSPLKQFNVQQSKKRQN